jgi:hypothetical protein
MSGRCCQESFGNGPRKVCGEKVVSQCLECSRSGHCLAQDKSRWPATTIAEGCPLPDYVETGDVEGIP